MRGRRRRGSQEVDPSASFSIEDEGEARGYYIGLVGTLLKWVMTMLGSLLIISAQTNPAALGLSVILVVFYLLGWMMTREAGIESLQTYDTILDVLAYGCVLGFVIRIVEGAVFAVTTGLPIDSMNPLSPFDELFNAPTGSSSGLIYMTVGLTFAAVAEELLHRGGMIYLLNILTDRYGFGETTAKIIALMAQAVAFGALHAAVYFKPEQIYSLMAGGIVFGLIFYWKKDLSVCIVAHLTLNLSGLLPHLISYFMANPLQGLLVGIMVGLLLWCTTFRGGNENE